MTARGLLEGAGWGMVAALASLALAASIALRLLWWAILLALVLGFCLQ